MQQATMEDHRAVDHMMKSQHQLENISPTKAKPADPKSKVVCPICSKKINGTANLSFHMALHPIDNPVICDYCVVIFRTKEELTTHVESEHQTEKKYKCETCGLTFDVDWRLRRHRKTHIPGAQYVCPYCDAAFRSYNAFRLHEVRHTGETPFKCHLCEVGFTTQEQLMRHVNAGKCTNPVRCCDMVFQKRLEYVSHFISKHRRTTYGEHQCKYCKKSFPFPSAKTEHETKCANGRGPRFCSTYLNDPTAPAPNEHGLYACGKCDMVCNSVSGLRGHHRRMHEAPEEKAQAAEGQKVPLVCPFCNKEFTSRSYFNMHKQIHLKKHACTVCGKKFAHNFMLRNHMYSHTQQKKPFQCKYCDKSFVTKQTLSDHENIHTGNRPYKCRICDSSYKKSSSLFYHMIKHKGEKPYKCKYCEAAFSHTSTCKQHEKAHHRSEGKKQFHCRDCSAIFWTVTQLKSHQESMHGRPRDVYQPPVEHPILQDPLPPQFRACMVAEAGHQRQLPPAPISTDEHGNVYYCLG